jgi:hypothetical protein
MFLPDRPSPNPPNPGQIRERRCFAWRPTRVNGGKVWLEAYFVLEKWDPDGNRWVEVARERGVLCP